MKSFKQYINESFSDFADSISSNLAASARRLNFHPADLDAHRRHGTHHNLLAADDNRSEIRHQFHADEDYPRTIYSFAVKNLKTPNPNVHVFISKNMIHARSGRESHSVDFQFGEHYADHEDLSPEDRIIATPHVYNGVMRALSHYAIHNNVDPSRGRFNFTAIGSAKPKVLPSGKIRKISSEDQKSRLYSHMIKSLHDLYQRSKST